MDIPKVHYSVLLGFLEILDDLGGKSDVAGIASKQGLELDDLLPILESGEMLGLIQVTAGDVSITEKGHLFIVASPKVQKKMLRDVVINLDTFKKLVDLVKRSEKGRISKDEVLEFVSIRIWRRRVLMAMVQMSSTGSLSGEDRHLFSTMMLTRRA